jgi:hypothetical protein
MASTGCQLEGVWSAESAERPSWASLVARCMVFKVCRKARNEGRLSGVPGRSKATMDGALVDAVLISNLLQRLTGLARRNHPTSERIG